MVLLLQFVGEPVFAILCIYIHHHPKNQLWTLQNHRFLPSKQKMWIFLGSPPPHLRSPCWATWSSGCIAPRHPTPRPLAASMRCRRGRRTSGRSRGAWGLAQHSSPVKCGRLPGCTSENTGEAPVSDLRTWNNSWKSTKWPFIADDFPIWNGGFDRPGSIYQKL